MSPEDVELAIRHAADDIIVSNHGAASWTGRHPCSIALRICSPAAKGKMPIALDGQVLRGSDIFRALVLGADFIIVTD